MIQYDLYPEEMLRYIQHIQLAEVGLSGQKKIKAARILVVGLGGLGSPVLLYLAAAGIGTLGIMDYDRVELTNLQRQIIYRMPHLGQPKVKSAQEQILALNPYIKIQSHMEKLTEHNVDTLIRQYDLIADGSDNFSTHYLLHDHCFKQHKPYVYASAAQFQGYNTVFDASSHHACLHCVFPKPSSINIGNCTSMGVLGVLPGLLGIIQATEIIKFVLGCGENLINRLLIVDLLKMTFKKIQLKKNPYCEFCGNASWTRPTMTQKPVKNRDYSLNKYALSVQRLIQLLKNPNVSLVDVRSTREHQNSNIGGQIIPLEELPQRLNELNRQHHIILYCFSGQRSQLALEILITAGFTSVSYLQDGARAFLINETLLTT